MLHEFVSRHREQILEAAVERIRAGDPDQREDELKNLVPEFVDELVYYLERGRKGGLSTPDHPGVTATATAHGAQRERLGYPIERIVHDFGAVCDAVSSVAIAEGAQIDSRDWKLLNLAIDGAIADSISLYWDKSRQRARTEAVEHTGEIAHELRNALSPAHMAFKVLQMGQVGLHSQTATILERALLRMSELVSQMFLDVRRQSGSAIERSRVQLSSLVDELVLALPLEREVRIVNQVDPSLECVANRTALVSSVGNILQNAIKYTRQGGVVTIRGHRSEDDVHIDVEDECGGLPARVEELMRPFVQRSQDRSGLGLGLSIARRAAMVNGGTLSARNLPGKGCCFTVTLSGRKDVPS